ncbi:MAG: hypothetical protein Kow00121_27720 [Elainellaceae cyanobacterium]
MLSQVFYLIRSKADGQYLVARPQSKTGADREQESTPKYLLLFKEHFDALSYLNTHGGELADQFMVESMPGNQLGTLLKRWGFVGMGLVQDPLIPQIEFLHQA